ncbi:MAG: hypothetical protein ACI8PB_005471 [Desulforhopalus sp.]|jgi:hypothetical protein
MEIYPVHQTLTGKAADTIQTCREMQDNRYSAYRWTTSSIRVEESGLKIQIVLISKASNGLFC